MILKTKIIDAYLNRENVEEFKEHWIYSSIGQGEFKGKNIFTIPSKEMYEQVREMYKEIEKEILNFEPYNIEIWSRLFPKWKDDLKEIEIYLIIGLPEPNDATVIPNLEGKNVIIFDLGCWVKYLGKVNITELVRNLLTHEICHILISKNIPEIDFDYENGTYLSKLNSLVFNEGVAHLLAYNSNICDVEWRGNEHTSIKLKSLLKLKEALSEDNIEKQNTYLYDAVFGNFYDKYGGMIGMMYFADIYMETGVQGLANEYKAGYKDITTRILKRYEEIKGENYGGRSKNTR